MQSTRTGSEFGSASRSPAGHSDRACLRACRQTVFYTPEALTVSAGDKITGRLSCAPNARNNRDLDITIAYKAGDGPETEVQYKMCVFPSDSHSQPLFVSRPSSTVQGRSMVPEEERRALKERTKNNVVLTSLPSSIVPPSALGGPCAGGRGCRCLFASVWAYADRLSGRDSTVDLPRCFDVSHANVRLYLHPVHPETLACRRAALQLGSVLRGAHTGTERRVSLEVVRECIWWRSGVHGLASRAGACTGAKRTTRGMSWDVLFAFLRATIATVLRFKFELSGRKRGWQL